jgi:nucleoside triphosphate diphosphatase
MVDKPDLTELMAVMAALRDPNTGCPWDQQQSFETIAPYTIEEAYEVAEAIRLGDRKALCDELGDLLLQVVYHARMAEEEGAFALADVIKSITRKMIRRHPHVFGAAHIESADAQTEAWEQMKSAERNSNSGPFDGVARALPALMRAHKIQNRAQRAELPMALAPIEASTPIGPLLFSVVAHARALGQDAEAELRATLDQFEDQVRSQD